MRTRSKVLLATGMVGMLTLGGTLSAFAGTWRLGESQSRWWYDFDNGSYAQNGWQWIDGNNDGIAECYYFDSEGWLLADTTTPDGYTVNGDGAWTVNGAVQTTAVQQKQPQNQAAGGQTQALDGYRQIRDALARDDWSLFEDALAEIGSGQWRNVEPEYRAEAWAQSSTLGAIWKEVFDRYNIAGIVRGECEFPSGVDDGELMVIEFAYKLFSELTY